MILWHDVMYVNTLHPVIVYHNQDIDHIQYHRRTVLVCLMLLSYGTGLLDAYGYFTQVSQGCFTGTGITLWL